MEKENFQSTIVRGEEKIRGIIEEAERNLKEKNRQISHLVSQVDKRAHENPWPIIAGVAACSLLLGLLVGKSKN